MFKIQNLTFADKGYYINLDKSKDRRAKMEFLKSKFDISGFERFSALTDEMIQFSCTKSHLKVFEDALQNNYDTIFVAEDDMDIREELYFPVSQEKVSFNEKIIELHNDLKSVEWDVILLGCNPKTYLIPKTKCLAEMHKSTGAWAYIIKKRAYEYVLKNLNYHRDYLAIDDFLPKLNHAGFTTLCTVPLMFHHSVGFESTLQPRGPVNYDSWIEGNYNKYLYDFYKQDIESFKFEQDITIVITGHYCDNFLYYLNYLIHSLPTKFSRCKFIINYDENSQDDNKNRFDLCAYFRDRRSEMNVDLTFSKGGLISSFDNFLKKIKTPYFIFLEHDWVFIKRNAIDFDSLHLAFQNNKFINAVWFSKDDNIMRGFEIAEDKNKKVTPFGPEDRVSEVSLTTTCRWSNNPVMFRTQKMIEWYDKFIRNEWVGKSNQGAHNVEESMISVYRKTISENNWQDIRDDWGTYLYGKIGTGPYVAHTDASKRYQGNSKSQPEINGEEYIKNNPLKL